AVTLTGLSPIWFSASFPSVAYFRLITRSPLFPLIVNDSVKAESFCSSLMMIPLGPSFSNLLLDGFIFHVPFKFGFVCAAAIDAETQKINATMADITQVFFIWFAPVEKFDGGVASCVTKHGRAVFTLSRLSLYVDRHIIYSLIR